MRLKRPAKAAAGEQIIALVDVVFFLLVFFMLVARLDASAPFAVLPPVALSGEDMPGGGVTLSIAEDGAMSVNGNAVQDDWLADLASARNAAGGTALIRINAHRATPLRHVLPVLSALESEATGRVVLVVTPPGP